MLYIFDLFWLASQVWDSESMTFERVGRKNAMQ